MNEIIFFVEGVPRAKQSFRSLGKRGGYTPAQVKAWQTDVAWTARKHMLFLGQDLLTGRLSLDLTFFLKDARKIDSDNLAKCVSDGLNGIVWVDDQQNIDLSIHKYICRGLHGVLIKVRENGRILEITRAEALTMIGAIRFTLAQAAYLPSEVPA